MKYKLKPITESVVVHIPTEAEAKELLEILHENGYKLQCVLKAHICYRIHNSYVFFDTRDYYEKQGYLILTLSEFKERFIEVTEQSDGTKPKTSVTSEKKPFVCIHWGEVDCNGDEEEDYTGNIYFRTPADRDKCIEEFKSVIEKYSK